MANYEKGSGPGGHNTNAEMPPVLTPSTVQLLGAAAIKAANRAEVGHKAGALVVKNSVKR